jgi:sirohydrochlorin cobaltochelatase
MAEFRGEDGRPPKRVTGVLADIAPTAPVHYPWRVDKHDFLDAALVLVGHGSTLNAESAGPTHRHADALRERGLFAQVVECFWKEEPGIAGVLRGVFAPRVFIVPLFISEGYFTEQVIPRELALCQNGQSDFARRQQRGKQTLHYCGPVGTHASMTQVIVARAAEVFGQTSAASRPRLQDVSLFIAGHGTGNNENSRKAIERQVELIRPTGAFAGVHAVFMEEDPRIADCYQLATTRDLVMVPFFISDGLHSHEDIPVMLGEPEADVQARFRRGEPTWINPTEKHGKRVWYAASIGNEPHLPEVILERVREMAAA